MIAARPTTYRGIRMRSRLEAKLAAEFDRQGWGWTYEPRAFANQHGQYLPDFHIETTKTTAANLYLEVKPTAEHSFEILERMQIIWDSDPSALLCVLWPIEHENVRFMGLWADTPDRVWRLTCLP